MPINRIPANIARLIDDVPEVVLQSDLAAGSGSGTFKSITGVAVDQYLLIRKPGNEHAEIIKVHASTAPSGNTITFATNCVESHPAGTVVYLIPWNQIEFFHSATEDDANDDATNLSSLASAADIDPTELTNFYLDAAQSSGYFYWRFSNSTSSAVDIYSDPIPYGTHAVQYARGTVGYAIDRAAQDSRYEWDGYFTRLMAIEHAQDCVDYIYKKLRHMSRGLVQDYFLGALSRGAFEFTLPTDIHSDQDNRSILNVRISGRKYPLDWRDEKEFDALLGEAVHTDVRTLAVVGGTTLDVDNTYGFDDTGTIHIYTANALDAITYDGITRSATAGVFSTIPASGDGAIGAAHAVDTKVWQGETEGEPKYYNIKNGKLRIYPLPSSTYANKRLELDYFNILTAVNSPMDVLDVDRADAVQWWVHWAIWALEENDGDFDINHASHVKAQEIIRTILRNAISGQKYKWKPKLNNIDYRSRRRTKFEES